jgi:hypothetical protein
MNKAKPKLSRIALGLLAGAAAGALGQAADAQTMSANSATFNAGYGRTAPTAMSLWSAA